jgi:catalase
MAKAKKASSSAKIADIAPALVNGMDQMLTTDLGVPINDDHNTLKGGDRGPTLLQDFIFREKIQHFDRERIPERVVHARGSGAHGVFQLYKSMRKYTQAAFLNDVNIETPVFVRFSTVAGSRGSADTARDVRGVSVKFYTTQGNYDLVGNNIPVFFVQDSMKFPDLVHAVKPEADNEMPQAASAHDTFWDFISLSPETTHMVMWTMSDRAIPRSLRMMEGFGVHTFKMVNKQGEVHFVKFHWKPVLGVHSLAWDEAQRISGKNADFHRQDLWEAIEEGNFPEFELGVQLIPEKDEHAFNFDLLDPTKLIPEELVPVMKIGKMTLNKNPDNFFAETEQVAFNPGNLVPGIDFSNDPLLQGRILSYTDTHLHRLGSQNFTQLPINRAIVPVHNNHRDGFMQTHVPQGKANYTPNSVGGGCPFQAMQAKGGYTTVPAALEGETKRVRSRSFFDHFSQAKLFYNSQSAPEQQHIKDAFSFELSKVKNPEIRARMVNTLTNVNLALAQYIAEKVGVAKPSKTGDVDNHQIPADGDPSQYTSLRKKSIIDSSAPLSMTHQSFDDVRSRCIAILVEDSIDLASVNKLKAAFSAAGAKAKVIGPHLGTTQYGVEVDETFFNTASVLFDACYVPGNAAHAKALAGEPTAIHFVNEQYKHCKAIGGGAEAMSFFDATEVRRDEAVVLGGDVKAFMKAVAHHRLWSREAVRAVPA